MTAPARIDDLTRAVDLILQPLVLETLAAVGTGMALEDALPTDTDQALLTAAVQRLVDIGAVHPRWDRLFGNHSLTDRGRDLMRLLENLNAAMTPPARPDAAGRARVRGNAGPLSGHSR